MPPEPARARRGFDKRGWSLAVAGLATGAAFGLLTRLDFSGHATGAELGILLLPVMIGLPLADVLLIICLAVRPTPAYYCYAAALAVAVWVTVMTDGLPFAILGGGIPVVTFVTWLSFLLLVATPFLKARPLRDDAAGTSRTSSSPG